MNEEGTSSGTGPRRVRSRTLLLALAALGAILIGVLLTLTDALNTQELQTVDTRFAVRGAQHPPDSVVIVAIDDATFADFARQGIHSQWPFPRRYHARVIDTLRRDGARAIAVDIQFTEPTDTADDNALIEAVARARGTVLGTTEVDSGGHTNIFGGDQVLRQIGARGADANVAVDVTGEIRRLPLRLNRLDTFAWATARAAVPRLRPPGQVPAWIDYAGPPGTVRTISYARVYDGRLDPALVRGKTVVIGPTSSSLQDIHPTPVSGVMPGAEVQADAIATFLGGGPLRSTPEAVDLAIVVLLASIAPLAALRIRRWWSRLVPIAAGGVYVVAAQVLFDSGWIVPVVTPLVALSAGLVATLGVEYVAATFERERVYDLFSRFVPDAVVKEVVARTDGARLGGVAKVSTVMFTDLRGFTSFASKHEPQAVIDVVNAYLGEMSDAILSAGGTLVTYMGDGIMAVFGAPLDQPDHADRAVAAAMEMLNERLPRFNALIQSMGIDERFRMGIGLNTGTVISGNVGSQRRLEYTTLGDTANLASRIEGSTKETPHMLLLSESTRQSLRHPPPGLEFVFEAHLRGANRPIKLWTVRTQTGPAVPDVRAAGIATQEQPAPAGAT